MDKIVLETTLNSTFLIYIHLQKTRNNEIRSIADTQSWGQCKMTKLTSTILTLTILLTFTSCDIMYFVAINNHGETSKVTVKYNNSQTSAWYDSDTLSAERLDKSSNTLIKRTNIDSSTYSFIIPADYQVELKPKSLGTPIKSVTFQADNDSTVTVELWGHEWRQLKRQGIVETKGFLFFKHTIQINRK